MNVSLIFLQLLNDGSNFLPWALVLVTTVVIPFLFTLFLKEKDKVFQKMEQANKSEIERLSETNKSLSEKYDTLLTESLTNARTYGEALKANNSGIEKMITAVSLIEQKLKHNDR